MIKVQMIALHRPERRLWKPRPKLNLRTLAKAVAVLQVAEGMQLHAQRDGCVIHAIGAEVLREQCRPLVPRRLMRDPEWVHKHIEAPGVRMQARMDDEAVA